ncbi:hypothetical protein DUNSADRAFT_13157 [Dunaliella salina]|uniref:Encoded protein n=1 Tax=Dunaliella salina TaxID=3046 RepID=A0ABQ7GA02_DUNSA|nr:hypothetical protein DUNSADRAFT_13157 [Dunaliella salina]|eukprot:KAF5831422.1 hypothetical protein DUNSADRAFT_13157 [Dunaliella salina]
MPTGRHHSRIMVAIAHSHNCERLQCTNTVCASQQLVARSSHRLCHRLGTPYRQLVVVVLQNLGILPYEAAQAANNTTANKAAHHERAPLPEKCSHKFFTLHEPLGFCWGGRKTYISAALFFSACKTLHNSALLQFLEVTNIYSPPCHPYTIPSKVSLHALQQLLF